jgi:hypothetical protein
MVKLLTEPVSPVSQAGLEARLEGLQAELDCLAESLAGSRAGRYLVDASAHVFKAVTLARQGL